MFRKVYGSQRGSSGGRTDLGIVMNIGEIFENAPSLEIKSVMTDSRIKAEDAIFFCLKGKINDGHDFIEQAVSNGAICVVYSDEQSSYIPGVTYLMVNDTREALNYFVTRFYGDPTRKMKVFGITGSNGKSTVAWIVSYLCSRFDKCGYIGNMEAAVDEVVTDISNVRHDTVFIHSMCRQMLDRDCKCVSVEVDSAALADGVFDKVDFDSVSFTNMKDSHLEYHGNFERYYNTKKKLFTMIGPEQKAIINIDEEEGINLLHDTTGTPVTYSLRQKADYMACNIKLFSDHSEFEVIHGDKRYPVTSSLLAEFNVYNVLTALTILAESGYPLDQLVEFCDSIPMIYGRMEGVKEGQPFNVIVDHTHTPEGFRTILEFARGITGKNHRVFTVFGVSGGRDSKKKAEFGKVAAEYSDLIILTMQDPRNEDPEAISDQIKAGILETNNLFIEERYSAISQACELANPGDTVVILGKGNDQTMEISGVKQYWMGDSNAVRKIIREMNEV